VKSACGYAYFLKCESVVKDDKGESHRAALHHRSCHGRGGDSPDGRKVKATSIGVSAAHALQAEVRLYDRLFNNSDPEASGDFVNDINPDSLKVLPQPDVEPGLANAAPQEKYQFERLATSASTWTPHSENWYSTARSA